MKTLTVRFITLHSVLSRTSSKSEYSLQHTKEENAFNELCPERRPSRFRSFCRTDDVFSRAEQNVKVIKKN